MCRNQLLSSDKMKSEDRPPNSPNSRTESRVRVTTQTTSVRLRLVVLGSSEVGKSALTVRYLTRRYIGEYRREIDLLYRHTMCLDEVSSDVEILDVSCRENCQSVDASHVRWGDGFVVVYSVVDRTSFEEAHSTVEHLQRLKSPLYVPVILVANKRDLDFGRQVTVEEGQALSLQHGCQFYELSAAESHVGATLAFQALLREVRSLQLTRTMPRQRRISMVSVSRMIGSLIGRGSVEIPSSPKPTVTVQESKYKKTLRRKDKKRPSLSL